MSVTLQYNYAKVNLETGECTTCITTSYEINVAGWIEVPLSSDDYIGKYYNFSDEKWYYEPEYITEFVI